MRVRRDISSIPQRSAQQTWQQIIALVTGPESRDKDQLTAASGVMASIITDEHPAESPIVLEGVGSQLRVYCRYAMKAIEEGDAVDALNWNPTAGDWTMHVPCDSDNLSWVTSALAKSSPRIKPYDMAKGLDDERGEAAAPAGNSFVIDWNAGT
jgi:hypothetical protein